jgi:hypothetical protein
MASHIGRTFRSGIPPAKPNFDAIGEKRSEELDLLRRKYSSSSVEERGRERLKEKKT